MQHLETCLLIAETDRVLSNFVELLTVFFYRMVLWKILFIKTFYNVVNSSCILNERNLSCKIVKN